LQTCLANKIRIGDIVRICLNRISFSETRTAKLFRNDRIFHGFLMKEGLKFNMDRTSGQPLGGQKQANWSLMLSGQVQEERPPTFSGQIELFFFSGRRFH
jgi:hypothetical protein